MKLLNELLCAVFLALVLAVNGPVHAKQWTVLEGREGPGKGKHIVFLVGDEE